MHIAVVRYNRNPPVECAVQMADEAFCVSSAICTGDLMIPVVNGKVSNEMFCVTGYVTKYQYRMLFAELFGVIDNEHQLYLKAPSSMKSKSLVDVYERGFYRYICRLSKFGKGFAVTRDTQQRLYSSMCEGLVVGVAKYKHSEDSSENTIDRFIRYILYYVDKYFEIESSVISGELRGVLYYAEMQSKRYWSGSYSLFKAVTKAYNELKRCGKRSINERDIVKYFNDNKNSKVSVRAVRNAFDHCGCARKSKLHNNLDRESLLSILESQYNAHVQLTGRLKAFSQDAYDGFEIAYKMREQLFDAFSDGQTGRAVLTKDLAEMIDIMYFWCLPLEDCTYTERVVRKNRNEIVVDLSVPSIGAHGATPSMVSRIPLADIEHRRHITLRIGFALRPALIYAARHKGGLSNVTDDDVLEARNLVKRVRWLITSRGYMQNGHKNCLPVLREWYLVSSGYVPGIQRTFEGDPIRVVLDYSNHPMVVWERPSVVAGCCNTVRSHNVRYPTGDAIECVRKAHAFKKRLSELRGRMEYRAVYILCSKHDADLVKTKSIGNPGNSKKKKIFTYYKKVLRWLPVLGISVGDRRLPGSDVNISSLHTPICVYNKIFACKSEAKDLHVDTTLSGVHII